MSPCHLPRRMAYFQTDGIFPTGICIKSNGDWKQLAKVSHARRVFESHFEWEGPQLHARGGVAHVALEIQPRIQSDQY